MSGRSLRPRCQARTHDAGSGTAVAAVTLSRPKPSPLEPSMLVRDRNVSEPTKSEGEPTKPKKKVELAVSGI